MDIRRSYALITLVALTLSIGCAATRKSALEGSQAASDAVGADAGALMKQAEEAWSDRSDKAKLLAAIDHWKKAAAADPTSPEPHIRLARAYYFLSDGHLRFEIEDEDDRKIKMGEMFGEGQYHGEKALLVMSAEFKQARESDVAVEEAVKSLPKEAVPAVYWWATNLGKWAAAEGFITLLANKDKVFSMMDFCVKTDEDYFFAAPHRYFGAYYTKIPLPSGDQERSRKHFDISLKKAPNYLSTRVLMAEYHAIKFQDRDMYATQLKYVLDADPNVIPELTPEHAVEKRKAKMMLAEMDDHFE